MKPGDKLPTEQELLESAGVSRTVVREAIAALKAERLVISRQGVGVFVAKHLPEQPFLIDTQNLDSLDEVVRILELRLGVEIEAAGLAAERRTGEDLERIQAALALYDQDVDAGGIAAEPDIQFHQAIAAATANAHFVNLIDYFGRILFVPGRRILFHYQSLIRGVEKKDTDSYLVRIREEHDAVFSAIKAQRAGNARHAMRAHLERARNEYHAISQELRAKGVDTEHFVSRNRLSPI